MYHLESFTTPEGVQLTDREAKVIAEILGTLHRWKSRKGLRPPVTDAEIDAGLAILLEHGYIAEGSAPGQYLARPLDGKFQRPS